MKICSIAAVIAALSFFILAGTNANADEVPSVSVRYADLDLSGTGGSVVLYKRLSAAARSVCRALDPRDSAWSDLKPVMMEEYRGCLKKAVIGAVAKINRPAFTSYVSSKMALPATMTFQLATK